VTRKAPTPGMRVEKTKAVPADDTNTLAVMTMPG
jgi:hypothetical protein